MFRQLAAADPSTDWSCLNPTLYATTFLAQQSGGKKICNLCMGADHGPEEARWHLFKRSCQSHSPRRKRRKRRKLADQPVGHRGMCA